MRVWRIPYSTNVERVALALAHKGLSCEWVDVDPRDRSPVRAVSGQDLVPVLEKDGRVMHDSTAILEYLEARYPEPPLYPRDDARRAEAIVFVDWFNRVWKLPPNEIEAEQSRDRPDRDRIRMLADELSRSRDVFEGLLVGRDHLLGDEFSVADCIAFPFLKYAVLWDEEDDEQFHRILVDHLRLDGRYPRLEGWIGRVDARPRA